MAASSWRSNHYRACTLVIPLPQDAVPGGLPADEGQTMSRDPDLSRTE